jgi:hypothetical protein
MANSFRRTAQEFAARRLLAELERRAAIDECVGALQAWEHCGQTQAREALHDRSGVGGEDAEAARVAAVLEWTARGLDDPDAHWD